MKRGGRLKTTTPLVRKTPLRQVSGKKQTEGGSRFSTLDRKPAASLAKPMKRARWTPAVPAKVRAGLAARSGGRCEMTLPGCTGTATDPAHRLKQGMGGRQGAAKVEHDRLSNLLHACRTCHARTHSNPADAYRLGLMLREGQAPEQVPVAYRGRMVLLDNDGGITPISTLPAPAGVGHSPNA